MPEIYYWPAKLLRPREIEPNQVTFSRTGGRTLGGIKRSIRTNRGHWEIAMNGVVLASTAQRRTWNAIRTGLCGSPGLLVIPVWSFDTAPFASGMFDAEHLVPHSDGTPFSDGTLYSQGSVSVRCAESATIGATTIKLNVLAAENDLAGVRFSYNHALYETGPAISIAGATWHVPIFPPIRAPVPAGAELEFNLPTCLVHLMEDRGMDVGYNHITKVNERTVFFEEATDYWSDLAAGLI